VPQLLELRKSLKGLPDRADVIEMRQKIDELLVDARVALIQRELDPVLKLAEEARQTRDEQRVEMGYAEEQESHPES
jgi:hypothetical protein